MLRFHHPKDSHEQKLYRYHESNFYNGNPRRYDNSNYVDHRKRRVSYEEEYRQCEIRELRQALKQMEKDLDEWFENFNLEEAVKKLEKSKAKVVNADDDNRKMVEESEIKVELEEEEKSGVVNVNEVKAEDEVLVDDSHISIVEELVDDARDTCVLEGEVEDHDIGMVNEDVEEIELKEEYHEGEIVGEKGIELYDIVFENPDVEQVKEADEWFEPFGGHAIDGVNCRVDAKKLWELLFQRGFVELEASPKPSVTGYFYLTFFEFCRFIFDPGGILFRFEDESFQEGGNDMIQARNKSKHWM